MEAKENNFISVNELMPPTCGDDRYKVSNPLIFRTKRNEFTGYYHFADKHWYTNELPYYKGHWARRITNVQEWKLDTSKK